MTYKYNPFWQQRIRVIAFPQSLHFFLRITITPSSQPYP